MGDAPGFQQTPMGKPSDQQSASGSGAAHQHPQRQQGHQPNFQQQAPAQQQHHQQHPQSHHQQQRQQYAVSPQPPFQPQGPIAMHPGPYDMGAMSQSLPKVDYRQAQYGPGGQRFNPAAGPSSSAPRPTPVPVPQYTGQAAVSSPIQPYYVPQASPMPAAQYFGNPGSAMHSTGSSNVPPYRGYGYYPGQMAPPTGYYYTQPPQYPQQNQGLPGHGIPTQAAAGSYPQPPFSQRRLSQPMVVAGGGLPDGATASRSSGHRQSQGQSETRASNVVRGPPRKPKQSGHAIWIGNLPPQTDLMSLVHHVCQQTAGLESLFLISKSNCAFANFQDEQSCLAAQKNLNDTWFMSVRLVCRLRKNAVEGAQGITAPTGPTAFSSVSPSQQQQKPDGLTDGVAPEQAESDGVDGVDGVGTEGATDGGARDSGAQIKKSLTPTSVIVDGSGKARAKETRDASEDHSATPSGESETAGHNDRFFILKSLTVEDLELSVRTGIWATQSHNEETLNNAFKSCDNVYLIFSANKSGEYFGYARMTSEVNQDPAAAIEFAPKALALNDVDLPKAIPTEATEFTPRGRIIDDSARGTIFWEAQREESTADGIDGEADGVDGDAGDAAPTDGTDGADEGSSVRSGGGPPDADGVDEPKAWGKPFQVEWLSTLKLPFFRTRGMRNPLNANREIKIARDGTEVDPAVGRKLTGLFHQSVASPAAGGGSRPMVTGYPPSIGPRPPY